MNEAETADLIERSDMSEPGMIECPHCDGQWDVDPADDLCHADDERDGIVTTCEACGGLYKLTTTTEVYFDARAVAADSGLDPAAKETQ